jgi:hypothetical protein
MMQHAADHLDTIAAGAVLITIAEIRNEDGLLQFFARTSKILAQSDFIERLRISVPP